MPTWLWILIIVSLVVVAIGAAIIIADWEDKIKKDDPDNIDV